jgi:hypothetical protein
MAVFGVIFERQGEGPGEVNGLAHMCPRTPADNQDRVYATTCRPRSSSLSFTTYRFTALCFAVTKYLRRCGVSESEIHREINDGRY